MSLMSVRRLVIETIEERQKKLQATMVDKNGRPLVIGDVVETKLNRYGSKFNRMGIVLGCDVNRYGEYFLKISDITKFKGYKTKFPCNVRKISRNRAILFKLENA